MNIVQKLNQYQQEHELNDTEMARLLNVTSGQWHRIQTGERQPGNQVWTGILNNLPQFTTDVLLALKEKVTNTLQVHDISQEYQGTVTSGAVDRGQKGYE